MKRMTSSSGSSVLRFVSKIYDHFATCRWRWGHPKVTFKEARSRQRGSARMEGKGGTAMVSEKEQNETVRRHCFENNYGGDTPILAYLPLKVMSKSKEGRNPLDVRRRRTIHPGAMTPDRAHRRLAFALLGRSVPVSDATT